MSKKTRKQYTSEDLGKHHFSKAVFHDAIRISGEIELPNSIFKVKAKWKRDPTKAEFYCISTGTALAHFLSICQQLENSVLYFSSFSRTKKMKKAGITRSGYILYCIENYIIRTQTMYDRLLRLIDKTYCIFNPPHLVSHELIVSNLNIKHSSVPALLKFIRKVIKKYHRDRDDIIHEKQYLEDDLRRLEIYTMLSTDKSFEKNQIFQNLVKIYKRQIVKGKTSEFSEVNYRAFDYVAKLFDVLDKEYVIQRRILEAVHGKIEVITEKNTASS